LGYGFKVPTARLTGALVYVFSLLTAAGAFAVGKCGAYGQAYDYSAESAARPCC